MGRDVFEKLLIADNKILKELISAGKDHHKILDNFAKHVTLYKECADKQDEPIIKAIIDAKKLVIMSDMGLLSTQYIYNQILQKLLPALMLLREKFLVIKAENLQNNHIILLFKSFNVYLLGDFDHNIS